MIKNKGFPYSVYSLLVDVCVNSITDYAGEIFGFQNYLSSEKLFQRAARSFLGVPKNAPKMGILSEIN